ncbi:MAG: ferredoxin [Saprospiraceae bacterium]|nr:ferredoxin [Saprospiraceae bacterium]
MKNNQQDNLLLDLFTEEAAEQMGIRKGGGLTAERPAELTFAKPSDLPVRPSAELATDEEQRAYWRTLRAFFRSGKGGELPAHCYPALLAPYRNRPHMERNFPLWMEEEAGGQVMSLHELLMERIARSAPTEGEAKILKDNLLRLEVIVREKMQFADDAYQGFAVIDDALDTLIARLNIGGAEGETFANDVNNLRKHIPRQGLLVPFSPNAPFYLLGALVREHLTCKRKDLQAKTRRLTAHLKDILAVEEDKKPESHSPEKLHGALDFAESFFNFEELSSVIPTGGAAIMPEERQHRIEKIVALLEDTEADFFQKNACLILGEELAANAKVDWENTFEKCAVLVAPPGQDSRLAMDVFDKKMAEYAELFAAIRTAELEVDNKYVQEIHGDFFAHFDWRSFTAEEMAVCPPVLLFAKDNCLMESELNDFSQLLSSNRPVKMLVLKQGVRSSSGGFAYRQELGAMAVAHRNAYVLQSASVAPGKLVEGYREGLASNAPALFHIFSPTGSEQTLSGPNLWTSAAVEGREFPGFVYNHELGAWGSRFNILHNPQPEDDWPQHRLTFQNENGDEISLDLPFTFADFAVQDGHFAGQFHLVPPPFWTDDLVPLGDYLKLPQEELYAKVPYIWVVDAKSSLQKAAVAWPLVLTCQERLDFWHFLQENAGIKSYHVEQATERLRLEMEAATAQKTAQLEAAHAAALEKAKEEEGRAAMERLAAFFLDLDTSELVASSLSAPAKPSKTVAPKPAPSESAAEAEAPKAAQPKQETDEILMSSEPWIDTPLCTSCNDCINLNKRMFGYNENKQAFIADPKAGTFRELVLAAEKCPVSIIHPGAPLNPNEPGIEELVKRAEKFN